MNACPLCNKPQSSLTALTSADCRCSYEDLEEALRARIIYAERRTEALRAIRRHLEITSYHPVKNEIFRLVDEALEVDEIDQQRQGADSPCGQSFTETTEEAPQRPTVHAQQGATTDLPSAEVTPIAQSAPATLCTHPVLTNTPTTTTRCARCGEAVNPLERHPIGDEIPGYREAVLRGKSLSFVFDSSEQASDFYRGVLRALCAHRLDNSSDLDAQRFRWLSNRFLGADFTYSRDDEGRTRCVLLIEFPEGGKVYGDLAFTVDTERTRPDRPLEQFHAYSSKDAAIREAIEVFRGFRAGCSICDDEGRELDWRDIDRRCLVAMKALEAALEP